MSYPTIAQMNEARRLRALAHEKYAESLSLEADAFAVEGNATMATDYRRLADERRALAAAYYGREEAA